MMKSKQPKIANSRATKMVVLASMATVLMVEASPPAALVAGILFALLIGHPFAHLNRHITKWLLQLCVVLLGFGLDLSTVLRLGINGSAFAAATIGMTLVLGWWLGRRLALEAKTSILISVGTAICGGSAIAAISSVIAASEAEIAVSIGAVFLLNAAALYLFPVVGHLLHMSQAQFGLWSGVAIHDISSVIGAGLSYGTDALNTATAVKLSRTLWIVPLTAVFAFRFGKSHSVANRKPELHNRKNKISVPWFIGLFLLASLTRNYVPAIANWCPTISAFARHGMVLVLFLIGTSISIWSLRAIGWRALIASLLLWLFISIVSLLAILGLHLAS